MYLVIRQKKATYTSCSAECETLNNIHCTQHDCMIKFSRSFLKHGRTDLCQFLHSHGDRFIYYHWWRASVVYGHSESSSNRVDTF